MSNAVFEFAADPTLTVYPAAQSECAQVKLASERYRTTVATRDYADGTWRRYTGTRWIGASLTDVEIAALQAAPRVNICG